ncbi:cytochrome c oxidase subunit NDUFA4 [Anthonomus grandis grandis]|uniref:cytochrome c oxidase subunit NDUFA4 n=1 Tax=Anthonomus grandis grandis TaxID=2921223 RepID=UPI002166B18D|nr:cytochrome c oxidase subunit NDUFA4 [Anthonomus grandis grandis]
MQGLDLKSLKKHPSLIPLFVCLGAGMIGAALYTIRLAVRNPDVQWQRTGEISNEEFRSKQYKFYSPTIPKDLESPAPKY